MTRISTFVTSIASAVDMCNTALHGSPNASNAVAPQ